MSGRKRSTAEVRFRVGEFVNKHGTRILVALLVLVFAAVGAAAGEGGELLIDSASTESGDTGP